jgi:hypothetical protein
MPSPLSREATRVYREQSADPVMNASDEQEPLSAPERVAGSVAMVTVALVTVLAFQGISQTQNQSAVPKLHAPAMSGPPAPVIGPLDLFRARDDTVAQSPKPETEISMPALRGAEKNPSSRSDSLWIQAKLRELGYYSGDINGNWGPVSRSALRDFKTMNGLPGDDRWDRDTEQALSSRQGVRASSTFVGGWALSVEACRTGRGAPIVIRPTGASTDGAKCDFRSVKRETAATWRIEAACSVGERMWRANVNLKLTASNLNWTSERGTDTYVRCPKP